ARLFEHKRRTFLQCRQEATEAHPLRHVRFQASDLQILLVDPDGARELADQGLRAAVRLKGRVRLEVHGQQLPAVARFPAQIAVARTREEIADGEIVLILFTPFAPRLALACLLLFFRDALFFLLLVVGVERYSVFADRATDRLSGDVPLFELAPLNFLRIAIAIESRDLLLHKTDVIAAQPLEVLLVGLETMEQLGRIRKRSCYWLL